MSRVRYYEDDPHDWEPWDPMTQRRRCRACDIEQDDKEHFQYIWMNRPTETTGVQLVSLGKVFGGEMIEAQTTVNGEIISQLSTGGQFYNAAECAAMRKEGRLK